jgi:hypothetical protein
MSMSAERGETRTRFRRLVANVAAGVAFVGLFGAFYLIAWVFVTYKFLFLAVLLVGGLAGVVNEERTKRAARRVAALRLVSTSVESLQACVTRRDTEPSRVARARMDLSEAIELANSRGVRLKTMSDELLTSLEVLNQMDAAIRIQMDAATERRAKGLTIRWGVIAIVGGLIAPSIAHKMGLV